MRKTSVARRVRGSYTNPRRRYCRQCKETRTMDSVIKGNWVYVTCRKCRSLIDCH